MRNLVYKISNKVNNKIYIGITQQDLKVRWQQHKCNSNKKSYHLYNAIKKYGFENFKIEIIFEASNKEEMFLKEIEFIKIYQSNNPIYGYNNSSGGESSRKGVKLTQTQKKLISDYQKSRKRNPHSEDTKNKISEKSKGRDMTMLYLRSAELRKGKPSHNVRPVVLNGEKHYSSITIASKETGVSVSAILNNIKGLSKKTKVGIWNYKAKN
jgi:group I intron endonuclease